MACSDISDWFKTGVFKRISLASRLSKFYDRVTCTLKLVLFETWSSHASDVSKEVLIEILKNRDVKIDIDSASPNLSKKVSVLWKCFIQN